MNPNPLTTKRRFLLHLRLSFLGTVLLLWLGFLPPFFFSMGADLWNLGRWALLLLILPLLLYRDTVKVFSLPPSRRRALVHPFECFSTSLILWMVLGFFLWIAQALLGHGSLGPRLPVPLPLTLIQAMSIAALPLLHLHWLRRLVRRRRKGSWAFGAEQGVFLFLFVLFCDSLLDGFGWSSLSMALGLGFSGGILGAAIEPLSDGPLRGFSWSAWRVPWWGWGLVLVPPVLAFSLFLGFGWQRWGEGFLKESLRVLLFLGVNGALLVLHLWTRRELFKAFPGE
ncbi:MAG TPA: hypothetical protein ENK02_06710 [Planctomycetes bacterium]|nr:hypothetical protein [Planctomycetota bacterium]